MKYWDILIGKCLLSGTYFLQPGWYLFQSNLENPGLLPITLHERDSSVRARRSLGYSVAVDSNNNVYISGETHDDLDGSGPGTHAGNRDAFLAKYVIPEPTTLSLLALGVLTICCRRRR